jgi:cell wall-associated NlpC family hydrolase
MTNRFILLLLLINLTACNAFRPASRSTDNPDTSKSSSGKTSGKTSSEFLRGISTGGPESNSTTRSEPSVPNGAYVKSPESHPPPQIASKAADLQAERDEYSPLQVKFAILTNSPVEELTNLRLLVFMDQWYGVPYHYGGNSKGGIDCSAFASLLISSVYDINQLPRVSADQYHATKRVTKKDLREGDLVFFHTLGKGHRVTHVGVYLYNDRFVHASIAGVQISNLAEGYYLHHYVGAGRIVDSDRTN